MPANNVVDNCRFYNFGRLEKTYAGAVHISGVGNTLKNSTIYNCPHLAVRGMAKSAGVTPLDTLLNVSQNIPYQSEVYRKYPNLYNICEDEPYMPKYNVISGNRFADVNTGVLIDAMESYSMGITAEDMMKVNTIEQ